MGFSIDEAVDTAALLLDALATRRRIPEFFLAATFLSVSTAVVRLYNGTAVPELLLKDRSDDNLVSAAGNGDRDAYAILVDRHADRVFAVCLGTLGNVHDAEDVAQDAFITGFAKIDSLRDRSNFAAWIARVAKNGCLDLIRSRRRLEDVSTHSLPDDPADPDRHCELRAAISDLSEMYRVPLLLYYFDGQSTNSVAQTLDISEAAVFTRISRARKELRRLLDRQGDER